MTHTEKRAGCPCGCQSNAWFNDPACKRNTTPAERYRRLRASRKAS